MEKRCCSERFCPLEYRKKTLKELIQCFETVPNPFVPPNQVASLKGTIEFIEEQKKNCRASRSQPTIASSFPDSPYWSEARTCASGEKIALEI